MGSNVVVVRAKYNKNTILVTLWNGFLAEERKQSVAPCISAQKTTSQQPNWSICGRARPLSLQRPAHVISEK